MDALDQNRIEKGKRLLLIALGVLLVLRLVLALLLRLIVENSVGLDQFDEIFWWMIPVILLMGAAVYRGGKAVRYIMAGILIVAMVIEIYLFVSAGFPDTTFMLVAILAWLATGFLLYVVMLNETTEEFFLYQRSKNYGEYAVVNNRTAGGEAQGPAKEAQASRQKAEKKGSEALEDDTDYMDDFEETVEAPSGSSGKEDAPKSKKSAKKGKKQSWDDELDLFE